jgi:flagellum-specific peptidoglycan hydrolase FlgJ
MTPSPFVIAAAQGGQRTTMSPALPGGIPASSQIAQFGQESGWGRDMPGLSNNPFGIKALPGQPSVLVPTHEFVGGRFVVVKAAFRVFPTLADAFEAHAQLLATAPVYAAARAKLPDVFAFVAAMAAEYATDPHYGDELTAIIRGDGLTQYDLPLPTKGS